MTFFSAKEQFSQSNKSATYEDAHPFWKSPARTSNSPVSFNGEIKTKQKMSPNQAKTIESDATKSNSRRQWLVGNIIVFGFFFPLCTIVSLLCMCVCVVRVFVVLALSFYSSLCLVNRLDSYYCVTVRSIVKSMAPTHGA